MGISTNLKKNWQNFTQKQVQDIVKLSWQDNTSFEEIKRKYQIGPNEIEKFLRKYMSENEFRRWKKRVLSKRGRKHGKRKSQPL